MRIIERYQLNKLSKIGTKLICPSCNSIFIKTQHQQVFCKTKSKTICKDKFWNTVNPDKRNNTTRISPQSALWLQKQAERKGFPDHEARRKHIGDFDGSWESHNCYVENCEWCGMRTEYCRCD